MQLRHLERFFRQVDAGDRGAACGHAFGEYATAASDIKDVFSGKASCLVLNMSEAQRIDFVQRLELAVRVPPARRERTEFFQFGRIGIHGLMRAFHSRALALISCSSM